MRHEPDPTTPDPVAYLRDWINWGIFKMREKRGKKAPAENSRVYERV